jgi:hypothetical protein
MLRLPQVKKWYAKHDLNVLTSKQRVDAVSCVRLHLSLSACMLFLCTIKGIWKCRACGAPLQH